MAMNIIAEVAATSAAASFNEEKHYYPIAFDNDGETFTIVNNGTAPAPCCITIIPKNDIMLLEIEGLAKDTISMSRIKADQVLIIDNINKKVTIDDVDAFEFFEGWELPYLNPGSNTIKITNGAQLSLSIEYQPAYI